MAPPTVTPAIKPLLVEPCLDSAAAVDVAEAEEDGNDGGDVSELPFAVVDILPDEVDIGADKDMLPVPLDVGEQFWGAAVTLNGFDRTVWESSLCKIKLRGLYEGSTSAIHKYEVWDVIPTMPSGSILS